MKYYLKISFLSVLSFLIIRESMAQVQFEIGLDPSLSQTALDGRLLLFISTDNKTEPRFQLVDEVKTAQVFGKDVDGWQSDKRITISENEFGYPVRSMKDLPEGTYYIQALLHKYETFKKADGYTVKLPMDRGEGQNYRTAPGNIYSEVIEVKLSPKSKQNIQLTLTKENPPIVEPKDTKYIKHIKIKSEKLTAFWGRDMYLGAHILLPEGFEEHPDVKYPLMVFHGHFPDDFGGFRETPPDPNLVPDYSERFKISGYNKIIQEEEYDFYKKWTGKDFPRFIAIEIQHANPFYDDSYAVNSANLGPYGDAIMYELIPEIEQKFRCIGEGWSRFTYGGSTGGWEALAVQVFYPEEFNGCFAACPDPIDFRSYTVVDIYKDNNAYYQEGDFRKTYRPGKRDYLGHVFCTLEDVNMKELALGTHSRSGDQWDIWQAVYSPVGSDGYPKPIWDKLTGEIDISVAEYWKENYDLGYILQRDWNTLGPKLQGKIHLYCGDMDNYYLNNAVYLVENFLKSTTNPKYEGEVAYGDRAEHCWNGDPTLPNHISRLHYNFMYLPKIWDRLEKTAPKNFDLKSLNY